MAFKKYYNIQTKQEEFLCRFIERVGCMSFWQAQHVLMEYYHCNEAQAGEFIKIAVVFGEIRKTFQYVK